jgi:hypothetical protein
MALLNSDQPTNQAFPPSLPTTTHPGLMNGCNAANGQISCRFSRLGSERLLSFWTINPCRIIFQVPSIEPGVGRKFHQLEFRLP